MSNIDSKTAVRLVAGGAIIIDLRNSAEFSGGHIPGAINLSPEETFRRDFGGRTVILYCKTGKKSEQTVLQLRNRGVAAFDLGSVDEWDYELR